MNLRNIKFENLENESYPFSDRLGNNCKHLQYWTEYRGVIIYKRELWVEDFSRKYIKAETYSLDRIKWYESLVDIQAMIKKLGK